MAVANILAAKKAGYSDADIAQYLAEQSGADYQAAIKQGYTDKDIIGFLNKQDFSFGEAFMAGAKAEVGSEITGAKQLAGVAPTADELEAENLARQAEQERGVATFLGRMAGGLINPSTLIPGTLLFKGAKGLIVGGSAAGGTAGFLRPIYEEEDLGRGASTLVGAVAGGALGGVVAKGADLINQQLAKKADDALRAAEVERGQRAVDVVDTQGARVAEPFVPPKEETLPSILSKAPEADQLYVDKVLGRYDLGDEIPYSVIKDVADNVEDPKLAALFRNIAEPQSVSGPAFLKKSEIDVEPKVKAETVEAGGYTPAAKAMAEAEDLANKTGDYRDWLTKSAVRFADIRPDQFARMIDPTNPYKNQNFKVLASKALEDQDILKQVEGALAGRFKYERQTGKTWEETIVADLVPEEVALQAMMNRKTQEILGPEVTVQTVRAARQAIDDLKAARELARVAREMGSEEGYAVLSGMMTRASSLLSAIEGNASNLGRALNFQKAYNKLITGDIKKISNVLQHSKGNIEDFYRGLDDIARLETLSPTERVKVEAEFTKNATKVPKLGDKVAEFVVNSYISGVATLAVNAMSALVKAPAAIVERALLGIMPGNKVKLRESVAMTKGLLQGIQEGLSFGKAGWIKGSDLESDATLDYTQRAIGGLATDPKWEQMLGKVVRVPTKASVAIDEFSKAIFRRMQFNAMVERLALEVPESALAGKTRSQLADELRKVDIGSPLWKQNISKVDPQIAQDIYDFSKAETFQAKLGNFGNTLLRARASHPGLVFILPFIKTPINIVKDALSYTPASLFMKRFKGKKDEAIARTMMGAGLGMTVASLIAEDKITGSYPRDPAQREAKIAAKIPEYSIKIGDQWYSYARVEPLATLLGVFTDGLESVRTMIQTPGKSTDDKIGKLGIDLTLAITKNLTSKTFLQGITNLIQAVQDPGRYGENYVNSFAGILVPAIIAQTARVQDPYQREVSNFGEALQARVPGMREQLPIKRDLLGEPKPNVAYGFPGSIGIASRPAEQTPVQREIEAIGWKYSPVDKKLRGVELSTTDYERYAQMSGELVNQQLSKLVETPLYQNSNRLTKNILMSRVAERSRTAATRMMLADKVKNDPEFYAEFRKQRLLGKGIEE
jgi:hypothetical protein